MSVGTKSWAAVHWLLLALCLGSCGGGGGGGGGSDSSSRPAPALGLQALELSLGFLNEPFRTDLFQYSADVGFLVKAIRVSADLGEAETSLLVNGVLLGSGEFSERIALIEGGNSIQLELIADDGSGMLDYEVIVTRESAGIFAQNSYLKASNAGTGDGFGSHGALSLFGETLAVGAPGELSLATGVDGDQSNNDGSPTSGAGAVYIFQRDSAGLWSQEAYLKPSNTNASMRFGSCVALSGDTLAVAARNEGSLATGIDGDQSDAGAGRIVVKAGAVYIFTRDGAGAWSQSAYLKASNTDAFDEFGSAIALDGDTLAVGAEREHSLARGIGGDQLDNSGGLVGAVYVFDRDGLGVWSQTAYIKASNALMSDFFGSALALQGETLVVGAHAERSAANGVDGDQLDTSLLNAGAAYVFVREAGNWRQEAYIKASNTGAQDRFGASLGLLENTLVVGAPGEASAAPGIDADQLNDGLWSAGAVYVFVRDTGGRWSQSSYIKASNPELGACFGSSLVLGMEALLVGADQESNDAEGIDGDQGSGVAIGSGAVYFFECDAFGTWSQRSYIKASNTDAADGFGSSLALLGDQLLIGAAGESSGASGVDANQGDNGASASGAVYAIER